VHRFAWRLAQSAVRESARDQHERIARATLDNTTMSRRLGPADLPEHVVRFAAAEVAAGHYASIEEVLTAGVDALRERAEADDEWLEYARDLWKERIGAAARGEFSEGSPTEMMARIRTRIERDPT
jgi:Arc/MetJ-type ribon-helix-helix transcriptional regulator